MSVKHIVDFYFNHRQEFYQTQNSSKVTVISRCLYTQTNQHRNQSFNTK